MVFKARDRGVCLHKKRITCNYQDSNTMQDTILNTLDIYLFMSLTFGCTCCWMLKFGVTSSHAKLKYLQTSFP